MAEGTFIEWARHPVTKLGATWNIVTGCDLVSPGCTNCYAMKLAGTRLRNHPSRNGLTVPTKAGPVWNGEVRFNEQWLTQPLTWKKPHGIFVAAHGDLFADGVTVDQIDRIFAIMALCPQHIFYVLTKRPERMRDYFRGRRENFGRASGAMMHIDCWIDEDDMQDAADWLDLTDIGGRPLQNVWLGVSVEDQKRADERIPVLLDTPAAIRFISAEPLLGPIDFYKTSAAMPADGHPWKNGPILQGINWIIAGGESGQDARPSHPDWFAAIRDQCEDTGTAFFFKQWGTWGPIEPVVGGHEPYAISFSGKVYKASDISYPDGGRRHELMAEEAPLSLHSIFKLGKKVAGRELDGCEHTAWPEVHP